jgi:hypothetical protein
VPERQLNLPLRRGGDKKRATELPKDAVMTMKEEEGELRFVALLCMDALNLTLEGS